MFEKASSEELAERQRIAAVFSEDLRALAVEALDRVVSDDFGLLKTWVAPQDGARWLSGLRRLRAVLGPPVVPDVPLFELEQGP